MIIAQRQVIEMPSRGSKTVLLEADPFFIRLHQLLNYNPDTGEFTWKVDRGGGAKTDDVAGSFNNGYREISIDGTRYKAHRLAWLMTYGQWPKDQLDHINRIKSDNRLRNLREATHAQNQQNTSLQSNNISGVKGVSRDSRAGKWRVLVRKNGRRVIDRLFDDFELAELVAEEGRELYHGEFARHA